MASECSKGATKGLMVTKSLSFHRSRCLNHTTIPLDVGKTIYRFSEQRGFDISMEPNWQLTLQ